MAAFKLMMDLRHKQAANKATESKVSTPKVAKPKDHASGMASAQGASKRRKTSSRPTQADQDEGHYY